MSRHGLDEVYTPPAGVRAVAHVVLVHGLFGHPRKTWTGRITRSRTTRFSSSRATSPSHTSTILEDTLSTNGGETAHTAHGNNEQVETDPDSVFWPQALLPSVIPDARIFTWGYDADIDGFLSTASQNTVHQHAINLLSDLADLRRSVEDKETPIIFLVHSLGGIIVKDALNESSQTEGTRLKEIAPATYAVCFLGTPHRGSSSASIGKLAYQIKVVATKRPNLKLLQALEKNSETLDRVGDSFRQTLLKQKIYIYSFREEKETRKYLVFSSIIVNADSAKIGDATEDVGSIPANHSHISKFATKSDIGFKRVSSQLRRWIEGIRSREPDMTQDRRDCLASLDNIETRSRFDDVVTSYNGTFHWLFDTAVVDFQKWLEDNQNNMGPIFWIQGKPGSGKSTLMKFAMRNNRTSTLLCQEGHWILTGFFFHDRGSDVQKSLSGMLQEILHQIMQQDDRFIAIILPFFGKLVRDQRTKSPIWDKKTLEAALTEITKQRDFSISLCLFLDALDEHTGDNSQLANLIFKLTSNADNDRVRLKVCLASRSWPVFESHFGSCPGFAIHDYTQNDIQKYTTSRLRQSLGAKAFTQSGNSLQWIEALAEQVTEKAQGVFIWVRLVVDRLEKGVRDGTPFSTLKEVVLEMPQELEDLYRHTLRRIEPEYANEAYIMLQIALCTLSPLCLQMFFKCVSYAKERVISDDQDQYSMTRHLVSRTGGLLEIVSRPMESSDFEGEVSRSEHEGSSEQAGSLGHGGSAAAQNQEFEQEAVVVWDTRPDIVMTVQFIHQTVKDFVRENRSDLGLRIRGIRRRNGYFYLLQSGIGFLAAGVKYDISIHIFEYASLAEKLLISLADEVDFQGELNRLVTSSHEMSTGWALRTWISMKHSPTFHILLILAMTRPQDVLTCLAVAAGLYRYVTHQISFSSQYWERTDMIMSSSPSLLQIAAVGDSIVLGRWDRLAMVKLLLSVDVPVDQQNFVAVFFDTPPNLLPHARTTLYWILNKRERLDVEIPENPPERLSIVRLLLENGANPNIILLKDTPKGLLRETALQHCVRSESEEMVRLFLQHGADPAPLNGWLPMNPFNRDFEMRRILEEHGCNYVNPAGLYNDQRMIAAVGMMPAAITGLSIQERWVNNH